jgi:hypothetical protein
VPRLAGAAVPQLVALAPRLEEAAVSRLAVRAVGVAHRRWALRRVG